jgi:16S rRNA C1402 N4-methylase RsmH
VLKSVQQKGTVVLVSFYSIEERFARNLICHLDKADMQNYTFLNDNSEFLDDIAHRGYPVINGTEFLDSIKMSCFYGI